MPTSRTESYVAPYVSTGHLPEPEVVRKLVAEAHRRFKSDKEGKNSQVYPALAKVPRVFGICVVGTSGNVYAVGDAEHEFTIMSVSKPFLFALVCQAVGVEAGPAEDRRERHRAGVQFARRHRAQRGWPHQPDGEFGGDRHDQPGAGRTLKAKWKFIHDGLSRFAGRKLPLNDEVYASATETNFRNQSIARLLQSYGRIYIDPATAVDLYTKQCAERERQGSGGDGRDAGRWRSESDHQGASGGRFGLPLCPRRDGHGRPVRNVRRLAVRHRAAGQERHRRRHRHGLAGQGRSGDLRSAARQCRQQCQGTVGGQVPVAAAGNGFVRLAARSDLHQ